MCSVCSGRRYIFRFLLYFSHFISFILIPARPLFLVHDSSHFPQSHPHFIHFLISPPSFLSYLFSASAFLFLSIILFPPLLSCRNLVESVLLWTTKDGDHQPRPADHDQRGHHPALWLGARAEWGLEAPRCRMDHRLQEHVRLSQVSHPSSTCCFISHGVLFWDQVIKVSHY